jgi:myosin heavy subunit
MMDKGQTGIFDQIDEATQLGSGTDEQLYSKIIKLLKDNPKLVAPKIQKDKFSIVHTAKNVEYTITGFRMKNKSEISGDLVRAVISSKNLLLHQVFLVVCGSEVEHMQEELEKMKKPTKIDKFLGAKFRS